MNDSNSAAIKATTLKFTNHPLYGEMEEAIGKVSPDAVRFIRAYAEWGHKIDDIIDEEICRNDPEFVLETFVLGTEITTSNFYREYFGTLMPQIYVITSLYADSVKLERSGDKNKEVVADTLRHCGLLMLLTVLSITLGYAGLRKYSTACLNDAWDRHHDKEGNPV